MNPGVHKAQHQPEAPLWQSGLDQRLLYRLLRPLFQAGLLNSRLARRILTQFQGISERLSLGRDIARRYGRRQFVAADAVPVVHAEWIPAPPVRVDRTHDREILEHQSTHLVVRAQESHAALTQPSVHFEPLRPLLRVPGRALSTEEADLRPPSQSAPEPMRKAATQGMEPTSQHPGRLEKTDVPITSSGQTRKPSAAEVRKQAQEAGLPILSPRGKPEPKAAADFLAAESARGPTPSLDPFKAPVSSIEMPATFPAIPPRISLQVERSDIHPVASDHRADRKDLTGTLSISPTEGATEVPAAPRGQHRKPSAVEVRRKAQETGLPILAPPERQEPKAASGPRVAESSLGPMPSPDHSGDRVSAVAPVLIQPHRSSRDERPLVGSDPLQLVVPTPIQAPVRAQTDGSADPVATVKQAPVHAPGAVPAQRSLSSPQRTLALGEAEMRELVGEVQRRLSNQWASDKSRRGMPR